MKKKLFVTLIVSLFVSLITQAQDISILNQGVKEVVKSKTDSTKNSIKLIQDQIDQLKKENEERIFLKQLQVQYEADMSTTYLAIDAKKNDIKMAENNLQKTIGVVNNKKSELYGLFNENDPMPKDQKNDIEITTDSLSKTPKLITNEIIDAKVVVNERYNQLQKDSLISTTLQYRRLVSFLEKINNKIEQGKRLEKRIDGDIENRKAFIVNAEKIKKDFDLEVLKKNQLINKEDSLITVQFKEIQLQGTNYDGYKKKYIAIKDGKLKPEEKTYFEQVENILFKEASDSSNVPVDTVSSKYGLFKEQYKKLMELNIELSKKKKQNIALSKKIEYITKINADLSNTIQSVFAQEQKSLEEMRKQQEALQKKLNDAKNGIFETQVVEQEKPKTLEKEQNTEKETTNTPKKKKKLW